MRKYPIGIQDFKKLREDNYLYIDKTAVIHRLIQEGAYYFLSRPRRFGKSLLLSTLKYLFQGEQKLFEGLWINDKYDFQSYPVIHLSFSTLGYKEIGLQESLNQAISIVADSKGIELTLKGIGPRLGELLRKISQQAQGQQVVLLIDEYDKPLVDYFHSPDQAEENRNILKNFFSVLKDADAFLKFLFITGVSKFSKVSIFSDLNHLRDITLVSQFSEITGYSEAEVNRYFESDIQKLADQQNQSVSATKKKIKTWYNGYTWDLEKKMYNPFSILNLFASLKFANYWWDTGTPTFLIKLLRQNFYYQLEELEVGSTIFESYTLENLEWRSLLFQTGYLTILDYDDEFQIYTLGYPNKEVKDSMLQHLMGAFRETSTTTTQPLYAKMKKALDNYDMPALIQLIDLLFSTIPYQIFIENNEAFFHAILHLTFQGLGLFTQSEVSTSKGRVDTIVFSNDHIYVIEFKLNESAQNALNQIRERRYGNAYLDQGKKVIALGISFDSKTKMVSEWKALPYQNLLIEG